MRPRARTEGSSSCGHYRSTPPPQFGATPAAECLTPRALILNSAIEQGMRRGHVHFSGIIELGIRPASLDMPAGIAESQVGASLQRDEGGAG